MQKKLVVLIVLDGFGYRQEQDYNAVFHADMPTYDHLFSHYPHAILKAAGAAVGLPEGYIGNSEVGHQTIGAGRAIKQVVTRIQDDITDGNYFKNKVLLENLEKLDKSKKLHIMGLLSDSGVHSHQEQFYATLKLAHDMGVKHIVVHPFLDGRDVLPCSAAIYLRRLETFIAQLGVGFIGSMSGRWYAMDRDGNWQRTEQCYDVLTKQQEHRFADWSDALSYYYEEGLTDEFIPPTQFTDEALIEDGDGIIMLNFRADRARQLTASFVDKNFDKFPTKSLDLAFFITPIAYSKNLATTVLYPTVPIHPTIKELLAVEAKSMFTIAETEKYAHVTYFFSGGKEEPFPGEKQVLVKSIPAKTYVNYPCMSAPKITDAVISSLQKDPKDFYLINYANPDMVGHSGDFEATVKACECVDKQLKKLYEVIVKAMNGMMIITADHGNAEIMYDEQAQQPHTAHTTNDVPFILVKKGLEDAPLNYHMKTIADIAFVILKELGIDVPQEMK